MTWIKLEAEAALCSNPKEAEFEIIDYGSFLQLFNVHYVH